MAMARFGEIREREKEREAEIGDRVQAFFTLGTSNTIRRREKIWNSNSRFTWHIKGSIA